MFARLLLLFTLVPLVELAILIWIGRHTGWLPTLVGVIGVGALGAWLVRQAGVRCVREVAVRLRRDELPTDAMLDVVMLLLAGALMITPGVLTDLMGLALLIRPVRRRVGRWLFARLKRHLTVVTAFTPDGHPPHDEILDVQAVDTPAEKTSPSNQQLR